MEKQKFFFREKREDVEKYLTKDEIETLTTLINKINQNKMFFIEKREDVEKYLRKNEIETLTTLIDKINQNKKENICDKIINYINVKY